MQIELSESDAQVIKWAIQVALDAVTIQHAQGYNEEIVGEDATKLMMALQNIRNRMDDALKVTIEEEEKDMS